MKYEFNKSALSKIDSDVVAVGIFQGEQVEDVLRALDASIPESFAENIAETAKQDGFLGKAAQIILLPTYSDLKSKRLALVGLGASADYKPGLTRKIAAQFGRRFEKSTMTSFCFVARLSSGQQTKKGKKSAVVEPESLPEHCRAFVEGWHLGRYSFEKYKSKKEDEKPKKKMTLSFAGDFGQSEPAAKAFKTGTIIAEATNMARALIAEPASYMTPTRLAEEAERIASEHNLECQVFDADEIKKMKMGSFLGVTLGAKEPAKFISLKYEPKNATKTVAVIGKGITFDSGGLSLKPAVGMENMKYDMSGAAAVLAIMQVVGQLKPKVAVLGLVAATENMPGSAALHPGDVLVAMNGKTIEVNNTDAEGRLVLADALTYACRQNVTELIDLATLTGAVVTALGRVAAGILGTNQELIDNLIEAGKSAGEKFWQLPMYEEYRDTLKSDIADLKNAGARGEAPTSSAAMFLKEFTEAKPWAHLDIAGPGWLEKDRDECNKGGTAFGVRTLCHYLLDQ